MDNPLSKLPKKKAKLEETQHLLERLDAREEEVSADRYRRLRERYQSQIASLEKEVTELTDRGETQKIELEDRLALQQEKKQEAEDELAEIETLHKQGAMDDDTYRDQRRNYRQKVKEAEKNIIKQERALDELNYYLTEVGEEPYRGNTLKGQLSAAGEQLKNLTSGSTGNFEDTLSTVSAEAQQYGEKALSYVNEQTSGLSSSQKWLAGAGIALIVLVVGIFSVSGSVPGEIEKIVFEESDFSAPISMEFPQESKSEIYEKMKSGEYNKRGGGLIPTARIFISDVKNISSSMQNFLAQSNLATFETVRYGYPDQDNEHKFMFYTDEFKELRSELGHTVVERGIINTFEKEKVNIAHRELISIDYTKEYESERRGVETAFYSVTFTYGLVNDLESLPYMEKTFEGKSTAYLDPGDGQWKLSEFSLEDRGIREYRALIEQNYN
jgi:hypothetical protein